MLIILMKIDKNEKGREQPYLTKFSKVADLKVPDSPPPEKNEDEDLSKPGKFEHLMQAACTIK